METAVKTSYGTSSHGVSVHNHEKAVVGMVETSLGNCTTLDWSGPLSEDTCPVPSLPENHSSVNCNMEKFASYTLSLLVLEDWSIDGWSVESVECHT